MLWELQEETGIAKVKHLEDDIMETGKWAGSPQAQKEGAIFSSSSTLQSLSNAPYWQTEPNIQSLGKMKMWVAESQTQHHKVDYRWMGLEPRDNSLLMAIQEVHFWVV